MKTCWGKRQSVQTRQVWTSAQEASGWDSRMPFLDIRVTHTKANLLLSLQAMSQLGVHEREKKRQYAECVNVIDHGTFTPLVFSTTGRSWGIEMFEELGQSHHWEICWYLLRRCHEPPQMQVVFLSSQVEYYLSPWLSGAIQAQQRTWFRRWVPNVGLTLTDVFIIKLIVP